jgi:outer membrane protein OmpA-like peptidoglycan-associated protein
MDERTVHTPGLEYRNQNIQVGLKFRLFGKKTEPYKATTTTTVTPPPVVIPDSDGDGINDNLDKCPNVAGVAKYEGCPVPDSDGDGINDENDKCPNQAGLAKYDGCPAPDKDGDGINDDADRCPDIAGLASNNGCPEVPANVSKSLGMSAQNISFGTTSSTNATLTTRSYTSLDQVVRIMNENPGLNIRVEGHTSNAGNADANMTLSENRANAVKTYLVSKGISADRITVEGFGGTQPIADNNTASGRMKNTRVDIRVAY